MAGAGGDCCWFAVSPGQTKIRKKPRSKLAGRSLTFRNALRNILGNTLRKPTDVLFFVTNPPMVEPLMTELPMTDPNWITLSPPVLNHTIKLRQLRRQDTTYERHPSVGLEGFADIISTSFRIDF